MANENIGGKVLVLLKLPNGGILRSADMPSDPNHRKGDNEIVADIIKKGIEGTNWVFSGISIGTDIGAFSLKYGG